MDEFIKENEETVASESVCENVAEENQNNIGEDIPQAENTETVETSASGESFSEKTETTPYYSQPAENHTSENFAPVYNGFDSYPLKSILQTYEQGTETFCCYYGCNNIADRYYLCRLCYRKEQYYVHFNQ